LLPYWKLLTLSKKNPNIILNYYQQQKILLTNLYKGTEKERRNVVHVPSEKERRSYLVPLKNKGTRSSASFLKKERFQGTRSFRTLIDKLLLLGYAISFMELNVVSHSLEEIAMLLIAVNNGFKSADTTIVHFLLRVVDSSTKTQFFLL
jgi:hypothetical protein